MFYLVDTDKTFMQASADLKSALNRYGFNSPKIYDLGASLRNKGISFREQSLIFDVCSPGLAAGTLPDEMYQQMAGPCRITVFTENGQTKIVVNKQAQVLPLLSGDLSMAKLAMSIVDKAIQIIDEVQ
jgi:uncharacterized protein (DUF302 family)